VVITPAKARKAGLREARSEKRSDAGAGFRGVHADENMGLGIFALQMAPSERRRVERGVVERAVPGIPRIHPCRKFFGHADREADL